jgi:hypothetical protein
MAPNRLQAYREARAAAGPQKGLTYSELLLDNIIGLDNDYLSAGEQLGQAFNADEIGFLKNAAIGAYEGAKTAVTQPLTTAEALLSGLYDSGADIASTLGQDPTYLDDALREMYGVGYDEATDEQVNRAREALFGDVLNVGSVATGLGAAGRGIAGISAARRASDEEWRATLRGYDERIAESQRSLEALREQIAQRQAQREAEREARLVAREAARIASLTGANTDVGQTQVTPGEAPFLDVADMDAGPDIDFDNAPQYNAMGLMPDEADEYGALEDDLRVGGGLTETEAEDTRAQLDELRETGRRRLAANRPFEVRPSIGQAEGIAGLYSPTRKAVDMLDRPSYDNIDSLRVQLLNRGAKPDELERLMAKIPGTQNNPMSEEQLESFLSDPRSGQFSKEDLARMADEASQDVLVSTRNVENSPGDRAYIGGYFLQGAEDIGSNVFEVSTQAPVAAFRHFKPSEKGRAPILHTRFGMFRSPGADKPDTYHLGEIQSDWAQTRQKLFPTQEAVKEAEAQLLEADNRLIDLIAQSQKMKADWEQTYGALSSMGGDPRFSNTPNIFEDAEFQSVENAREKAREEVGALQDKIRTTKRNGTRDEFDAKHPAPYVGTTSKWVQLGLRQSLLDAANKGAKRMTLSTGEQVKSYTFGKESGQNKFYNEIVPKELEAVLKKFAKEAGIRKPEITTSKIVGTYGQEYMVPTVEFTDEFVEALKRVGLPAYAKGGIVKGSYLDNDPFEPALY